jgi:arabinogalactan endo-1,4-beta-galactosidase
MSNFLDVVVEEKKDKQIFIVEATYGTTKKVGNGVKQTKPSSKRKMKIHTRG